MNFDRTKIISNEKLLNLRGGDRDVTCCLWCFGEKTENCGSSGTGDCSGAVNPDPENCEWRVE